LSREGVLETLQYLQRLTAYGIAYRSYTEMYLDSLGPFRDAVLAILACIARQEKIRISERTRAGLAKARSKGRVGGRPKALKDASDVERIRQMRSGGSSFKTIAQTLGVSEASVYRAVR
jgi:DNA invertase Pin-like site-specific DNA recombinase